MHGIRLSGGGILVAGVGASELGTIVGSASILAIVIDIKIVEVEANFLTVWAGDIWLNNGYSDCSFNKSLDSCPRLVDSNSYCHY